LNKEEVKTVVDDEILDPSQLQPLDSTGEPDPADAETEILESIQEAEEQQAVNEALINVPDEFQVNGTTIKIKSKTPRQIVVIDKAILKLLKSQYQKENVDVEDENFWDTLENSHQEYFDANIEVIWHIINDNYDKPEHDKEWIMDNVDLGEDGLGEQILDAYNKKCTPSNFFQKAIRSRKF